MAGDDRDGLNCQLVLDPNWRNIAITLVDRVVSEVACYLQGSISHLSLLYQFNGSR